MIRPGDVFLLADNVGIAAFAITGMLTGIRHRLDIIGILTAGYLTAFGGGIMRDAMLGRIPYVFQDPVPSSVATISVLLVLAFYFMKKGRASRIEQSRITIFFDAVGLSSFSIAAALLAIDRDLNLFGVVWIAFITATGGGMVRDMLLNRVPKLLFTEFYGTISILIGLLLYLLSRYDLHRNEGVLIVIFVSGVLLRLAAYRWNWSLPVPDSSGSTDDRSEN